MYCTIKQLEDRLTYPVLGQLVPETGAERTRVLEGYIDRAGARIDMRLSARYQTPAPASDLLADICLSFCLWQIEADRGSWGENMPKRVQVPYDEAVKLITALAGGGMDLPGMVAAEGAAAGLVVQSPTAYFLPSSPGMEDF